MDYEFLWNSLRRQANEGTDLPFCRAWLKDLMDTMEIEQMEDEKDAEKK
jgi:hypothetical protein